MSHRVTVTLRSVTVTLHAVTSSLRSVTVTLRIVTAATQSEGLSWEGVTWGHPLREASQRH